MEAGEAMKIYEFGLEHEKTFVMFQCAAEPWRVFKASAEIMARDYHVYLVIADGHDETGTEFISLEKNVKDAADALRKRGVARIEAVYGVSMGGASVIRFLATEDIPVERAVIDAGITPYLYPRFICRLTAVKDWIMIMLGTKSMGMMKLAAPLARWTPRGEDPESTTAGFSSLKSIISRRRPSGMSSGLPITAPCLIRKPGRFRDRKTCGPISAATAKC